jgi:hypothetical protein
LPSFFASWESFAMISPSFSTIFSTFGPTFEIVLINFLINVVTFEIVFVIAVVACAATAGVANPSVHASSRAQLINFPTNSAIKSRPACRTAATT